MSLYEWLTRSIRTVVPIGVGTVLAFLGTKGVVLDEEASNGLAVGVTGLASGGWYALFHLLEQKWPAFGWFLGWKVPDDRELPLD